MAERQLADREFRVAEALVEDVGRCWARLDPDDLKRLGAVPGDVLRITGGRATVARAIQAPPSHCGLQLIQIDGNTRGNAQVGVDDWVQVEKVPFKAADSILLAPVEANLPVPADEEIPALRQLLSGCPLVLGDRVHVTFFGGRPRSFMVEGAAPRGAVIVSADTQISFRASEDDGPASRVSYEDIGGLGREVALVREMVELPLRFPELFGMLGIEAPRGVLLTGSPGTGKTLIARAVSNEVRAHFIHVNGPEIIHKYYGESEAKLRQVFDEARRNAPSVIFLDELDALAPKRAQVIGDVEKRVVAQLLALMDGLVERGQVVVMGATNLPDMIDPALRRPGRFDREITIGVPDRAGRRQILGIHSRRMPRAPGVDLDRLAEIAHGYVGADLAALCKEAGMVALRRILPAVHFGVDEKPRLDGVTVEVTQGDFLEAFKVVEPTSTREFASERPLLRLADVGGLAREKRTLRSIVELVRSGGAMLPAHFDPPKGILLTGPSGTGKTLLAHALAGELGLTLLTVDLTSLLSKWVGESEKGLRDVFKRARQNSPCILFFDEVEGLAPARSRQEAGSLSPRLVSQLFRELDDLHGSLGVVVMGATNRPDLMEPALLRPGRFDYVLELPLPGLAERQEILAIHAEGLPLESDVDLAMIAERSNGLTGADLQLIWKKAALLAFEQCSLGPSKLTIGRNHLEEAFNDVQSGLAVAPEARSLGAEGRRSAG
jgi:transitional endoplasmic reticulum ATPase